MRDEYMSMICLGGLRERYGDPLPDAVVERFEKERAFIVRMGFLDYFLVIRDVVNFARENDIPVGPGKGCAAGSIIAYGLGITGIDPLRYGLYFERFLNEGGNEIPDIALDFGKERRHEVVNYIIERHGADHCVKIINRFDRLSLKFGIRDDEVTTQYEMKTREKFGLCKIDVLGLETLSLINNVVENIRKGHGIKIDMENLPLDDRLVYDMLSRGDAKDVFQFESEGFRQSLSRLKPDVFEELIAAVAIYRPGTIQFLDSFINRKHQREPIVFLHPRMEPHLKETYGLILYPEQIMALAHDLAHFSLSDGDLMFRMFRAMMDKHDGMNMAKYREKFITQAETDIGRDIAEEIYCQIEMFAAYSSSKSHAACYALMSYQTAWLKCHYPEEYMAAITTVSRGDSDNSGNYSSR